jgi:calmodulin
MADNVTDPVINGCGRLAFSMSDPNNIFTPQQREIFRNAFDAFDENRDDQVSVDVLGKLMRAVGYQPLVTEVEDMIEDIGGPTFDFETLLYLIYRHAREADPQTALVEAFKVFDKDGTGKLQISLVRQILRNLKRQPYTSTQVKQLFTGLEGLDRTAGTLQYEELAKKMVELNS